MSRVSIMTADRTEQAAAWAVRLADGEMSFDAQAEFQAWLEADPENSTTLEEIVGAWRSVERYAANAEVMELREAALASARKSRRPTAPPQRRLLIWGALAASLVLMLGGLGVWAWLSPRTYETGVGERRVVALSDGSKVSLDAATVVKVAYNSENRRLWLEKGRAKFEVAKNPLRPFSVTAGDKVVVATGTAFSVELVQKQVRVVLYEGHVALLERDGAKSPFAVTVGARRIPMDGLLVPGREAILPQELAPQAAMVRPAVVTLSDPVRSLSWEAGLLEFEDERLSVVVDRMNRYAERPLVIGDPRAANLRISGVFRAGDTDALVQGLAVTFGVQAQSKPDAITLFKDVTAAPAG
jgi:transmembrane sensor